MRYEVPEYSQYLDVEDKEWQGRTCGIVSLKMLVDYWLDNPNNEPEEFEKLIENGLERSAYIPGIGWRHHELSQMAKGSGLDGESFDWTDEHKDVAFNRAVAHLSEHPIMASVYKNLKEGESGHLVVLTGYENGRIFYSDPDSKKREDVEREATLEDFLNGWTKRIILVHPDNCVCTKEKE